MEKIIWKVLLMFGGIVGSVYSCPKFVQAFSDLQDCLGDNYSYFLGPSIKEHRADAIMFGVLSFVCILAFMIGFCISVDPEKNDDQQSNSDSKENRN